jgi:DNA-binding response OmpR family regulator
MREILIVEDEEDLINILGTVLTDEGYKVTKASSAEEALLFCRTTRPDLVLSDIKMAKMDGFDLLESLKGNEGLKSIPFVFLTSLDEPNSRMKGLQLGAAAYITKPFDIDELLALIVKLAPRDERPQVPRLQ